MQNRQRNSQRRNFLYGAATAGAAAAAVVALAPTSSSTTDPAQPGGQPRALPEKGGGYHLSAHIRQYYQTTRIRV